MIFNIGHKEKQMAKEYFELLAKYNKGTNGKMNRVVQKPQFLNNFRLKTAKCGAFCETCSITRTRQGSVKQVIEQVQ
jgi:hypothetical protein